MNKEKGYKLTICLLSLAILIILGTIYILYSTDTISFKNKTNENSNISENNSQNNDSELLALGLSMYKYANQLPLLFHTTSNNDTVNNYKQVAENFSNEFINNAKKGGMCWPTKNGEMYYTNWDCVAGGTVNFVYKSIKVKNKVNNKVTYIITIDQQNHSLTNEDKIETTHKDLEQEFEIIVENNMWKINKFTYNAMEVSFN